MLKEDGTKELMLQVITWAQKKYNFELHAFDIMDIDFIFIIKTVPGGETISRIMQYIKSQFARRFNARHGRTGPFWNERFHDEIFDFLPEPAISFIKIIRLIQKKNNKYSCWCSSSIMKYAEQKKKIKKEVLAGINISHHKFFNVLGSSLKEQAEELLKMDYRLSSIKLNTCNFQLFIIYSYYTQTKNSRCVILCIKGGNSIEYIYF